MTEQPLPETYRWYYFIPLSGNDGRRWYEEYRSPDCHRIGTELDLALGLLRQRQIGPAKELLVAAEARLAALAPRSSPAVVRVLERWYHSTYAYFRYFVGDGEGAKDSLDCARGSMAAAIELAPFLVVLATACCEFSLHYARIARRQRRWQEMARAIDAGRAMVDDRQALCQLGSGREIFISEVDGFYRAMTPADDNEREALEVLLNAELRRNGFERAIRGIELIPNVVVPFN
jgi:hypothetical protein